MHKLILAFVGLGALVAAHGGADWAAAQSADKGQIEALIRTLGNKKFTERERATEKLLKLGSKAIPFLEKAAAESSDLEVRRRARAIVNHIRDRLAEKTIPLSSIYTTARQKGLIRVEEYLVDLPIDDAKELDAGRIPNSLKRAFASHKYPLPRGVYASVPGKSWGVSWYTKVDEKVGINTLSLIRRRGNVIRVYPPRSGWVPNLLGRRGVLPKNPVMYRPGAGEKVCVVPYLAELLDKFQHKRITGASNTYLVRGDDIGYAVKSSQYTFDADVPATPEPWSRVKPEKLWLVVYLGQSHNSPPHWLVESVTVKHHTIEFRYRKQRDQKIRARKPIGYYYWVPLPESKRGLYELKLVDSARRSPTLIRWVSVGQGESEWKGDPRLGVRPRAAVAGKAIPFKTMFGPMPGMRSEVDLVRSEADLADHHEPDPKKGPVFPVFPFFSGADLDGGSNLFLVRGDMSNVRGEIGIEAVRSARRVVLHGESVDNPPQPDDKTKSKMLWMVVYFGTGPTRPTYWVVESVTVQKQTIEFRYTRPRAGDMSSDGVSYLYWIPLPSLKSGVCELRLYHVGKQRSILSRWVNVLSE